MSSRDGHHVGADGIAPIIANPALRSAPSGRVPEEGVVAAPGRLGPELGGREPHLAPEGFRELRRLAVADPVGDLAYREVLIRKQLGCMVHSDPREVLTEGRASDLSERPLQLPAGGGDPLGDVVQLEVLAVFGLDEFADFLVEAGAVANRRWALDGHALDTA